MIIMLRIYGFSSLVSAKRLLDFSVFDKDLDHVGEEAVGFSVF